jgi:zinc and cadmium transporter
MNTLAWIVLFGILMSCIALVGSVTLVLKQRTLDRILLTDVGSGAGSISRAADTHLVIRQHREPGLAVLDAACRSFPPVKPISLQYEFPLWSLSSKPVELRKRTSSADAKKASEDEKGKSQILETLQGDWLIRSGVRRKTGMNDDRCNRLLRDLLDEGKIETEERQNPRNKHEQSDFFRAKS